MNDFIESLYHNINVWQSSLGNLYTLLSITNMLNTYPTEWITFKYRANASDYTDFYNKINELVLETDIDDAQDNNDNNKTDKHIIPAFKYIHYDLRLHLNKQPVSLNALLKVKDDWKLLRIKSSAYHMHGENGEYNLKFISKDGHFEAVYSSLSSNLVLNPWNIGTYNFANPSDKPNHYTYDVEPFFKWNNTPSLKGQGVIGANLLAGENIARYNQSLQAQENYNKIKSLFKQPSKPVGTGDKTLI